MGGLRVARQRVAVHRGVEVRVPLPVRNTIQGGAHAINKVNVGERNLKFSMSDLQIQERHLIPITYDMGNNQVTTALIQDIAASLISRRKGMRFMGTCNEGGIGARFGQHGEMAAWQILAEAVKTAGFILGKEVAFGVDGAADRYYQGNGVYKLDDKTLDLSAYNALLYEMIERFPMLYVEDLFASTRDAWDHWSQFTAQNGHRLFVCMDDIATTNARLVRPLIEAGCGNMLLLKLNQIGSVLEGLRAAEVVHASKDSRGNPMNTISSHRSTSGMDLMEVEVALALSHVREGMGRVLMTKLGGSRLIERATRFAMTGEWVEDWASGNAEFDPISPDVTINIAKAYPAPLNTGQATVGVRFMLSDGREISVVVPAGTSTGETEAWIAPVSDAIRYTNDAIGKLGLVGSRLGDLPSPLDFHETILAMELKEALRQGKVTKDANVLDLQIAAEMKQTLGAQMALALTLGNIRLWALTRGVPSWLAMRMAVEEMHRQGKTFNDRAFYDPIIQKAIDGQ